MLQLSGFLQLSRKKPSLFQAPELIWFQTLDDFRGPKGNQRNIFFFFFLRKKKGSCFWSRFFIRFLFCCIFPLQPSERLFLVAFDSPAVWANYFTTLTEFATTSASSPSRTKRRNAHIHPLTHTHLCTPMHTHPSILIFIYTHRYKLKVMYAFVTILMLNTFSQPISIPHATISIWILWVSKSSRNCTDSQTKTTIG